MIQESLSLLFCKGTEEVAQLKSYLLHGPKGVEFDVCTHKDEAGCVHTRNQSYPLPPSPLSLSPPSKGIYCYVVS